MRLVTDAEAPADPRPDVDIPEECEWCRGWDVVYACAHCDRSDLDAEEEEK
jgi:hypothetical protein